MTGVQLAYDWCPPCVATGCWNAKTSLCWLDNQCCLEFPRLHCPPYPHLQAHFQCHLASALSVPPCEAD
jgi:hypothetical protein